jgi:fumarate reductase flavoprotein subunit
MGNVPSRWDYETEVLILGGGGAGTAAAYVAAKDGAKVIVLESQPDTTQTSTAICGGYHMVIGSDEQKAMGVNDSIEAAVADFMNWGNLEGYNSNREDVIRAFLENQLEYYHIMKELGVEFRPDVQIVSGSNTPRTHIIDPADHMAKITRAAADAGAEYLFNTTFSRLIYDGNGVVLGAYAEDSSGSEMSIKASKGVLLATGGICRNAELLDECMPGMSLIPAFNSPGHTGLGHLAVMELGGAMWGRSYIYAVEGMAPKQSTMDHYAETMVFGAIKVNTNGDRFTDDGAYWGNSGTRDLLAQPMKDSSYFCWQILDQAGYDRAKIASRPLGVYPENEPEWIMGETIEALAEKIQAPNLSMTLNKYNTDLKTLGEDQIYHRKYNNGEGTGEPVPLDTPPFYAWGNCPWLAYSPATSFYTNGDCQILDQYGDPIGGGRLWAAGEIMLRSIIGNHYIPGTAVGSACALGLFCAHKMAALDAWDA